MQRNCFRLPKFNESEVPEIAGSADFLGINHYTTQLCIPKVGSDRHNKSSSRNTCTLQEPDINDISYYADMDIERYQDSTWYP